MKTQQVADTFLSNVIFETNLTGTDLEKNISAIRLLIYHIADNPVGLRLLQRILHALDKSKPSKEILFSIGSDFDCVSKRQKITIPRILFDENIARKQNVISYSPKLKNSKLILSSHERPFYIGLVHELIHLMHRLENRTTGRNGDSLDHTDFGGESLWGILDDLHTIWGIYAIKGKTIEYDNVSELTFRIADNIPIRMFYERPIPFGNYTNLDTYKGKNIQDLIVTDDGKNMDFIGILKNILTSIGMAKKIITSI